MAKIDLDRFVGYLLEYPTKQGEGISSWIRRALKDQGLVCKDGEIVADGDAEGQSAWSAAGVSDKPAKDLWSEYMSGMACQVIKECKDGEKAIWDWVDRMFWLHHPLHLGLDHKEATEISDRDSPASKNEEIRKAMIDFFKHEREEGITVLHYGVNIECMIAWLENQGEKELDPRYSILDKLIEADDIYQMSVNDAMVEEAKNKAVEVLSKLEISKLLGLEKQGQVKEPPIFQHENKTCKENDDSLTSEDERIRKSCSTYFAKFRPNDMWDANFSFGDIVAWLERQGEHANFINKIQIGDKVTRNAAGVLVNLSQLNRVAKKDEQILANSAKTCKDEQKPADVRTTGYWNVQDIEQKPSNVFNIYEKSLLEKFKQAVYDCAWGKVTCKTEGETQEEYAERWAEQFLLMVRDWVDDHIDFTIQQKLRKSYDKGKENAIKENRSSWSEEDEKKVNGIITILKPLHETECDYDKYKNSLIAWFESLKDRVQPKREWSEEDKYNHNIILYLLNNECVGVADKRIAIEWFKSLKDRCTWKPSDEQMNALNDVISSRDIKYDVLSELWKDLKKLRGE